MVLTKQLIQVISAYFLWLRLVSSWERLGSLYYNCIYLSRIGTLSGSKGTVVSHLVIIRLANTKANSYSILIPVVALIIQQEELMFDFPLSMGIHVMPMSNGITSSCFAGNIMDLNIQQQDGNNNITMKQKV